MSAIGQFLTVTRRLEKAKELERSTLSWRIFGDTKKLQALEDGADLQTRRFEQAMAWLSANWPADVAWPEDVPRPERDEAAA